MMLRGTRHGRARNGSFVLIGSTIASLVVAGSSVQASAATAWPTLARIEVRVTTSSDWTTVRFLPGTILASRILAVPSGVTTVKLPSGLRITCPNTTVHQVLFSAVYQDTGGSPTTTIVVGKGSWGQTKVEATNTSSGRFPVVTVVDAVHGGATNPVSTSVAGGTFFGSVAPAFTPADPRHLVLAFYYPWWTQSSYRTNPYLTDHPLQPRGTFNAASVLSMTQQARANGIDGFIVSWAGETNDGLGFDAARQAAESTGGITSAIFETARATSTGNPSAPTDPAIVQQWLRQLLVRAASSSFLKVGGIPVVFVYSMNRVKPADWSTVLGRLAAQGLKVHLVGDTLDESYRSLLWGYYEYNPNAFSLDGLRAFDRGSAANAHLLTDPSLLYAATVSPGLDDHLIRNTNAIVPRGANGERYAGTWDAALSEASDWVLVTSWNEWSESTTVEPSVNYGDLALRQTAAYAAQFHQLGMTAPVAAAARSLAP